MRVQATPLHLTLWPRTDFPPLLDEAAERLSARVLARLDNFGAMREPCHSRVLESALALRLLERFDEADESRRRLRDYLRTHHDSDDSLDRLLVEVALRQPGDTAMSQANFDEFVARAPAFTAARKQMLIDAVLVLFDVPPSAQYDLAEVATIGLHSWAAVQVTALKVILAAATGRRDLIRTGDVALLLSTQREPGIWEANVLIHLSVLHALALLPDTEEVIAAGIGKLLTELRSDGGLPFISDTDTWCSATAGVALSAIGAPRDRLLPLAQHLAAQQLPNGGWSFTDGVLQSDVDDTSVAIEFLHSVDAETYRTEIRQGMRSLLSVRGADGGFPTYVAGSPSEACMTAAAVNALSTQPANHRDAMDSGLTFLAAQQHSDGSFAPDWSASRFHTLFRVMLACGQLRADSPSSHHHMAAGALRAIRSGQNSDGGWGQQPGDPSDALSTSYALIALSGQEDHRAVIRGVDYLMSNQLEDGGISTVPDSIGPRPFIFTIPLLADTFALMAFGHLFNRLEPAGVGPDLRSVVENVGQL
ncbi:prenyltransferase/squalene oxidase repeat-containing protein [Nocardia sp. NPDC051463]|uniref:prenyltransferase/squalene oxidase repeat-containing protein n=1 Tax=Nocardia sp. NPDC051463 TaxID=3154845 RepID=UPI00344F77F1